MADYFPLLSRALEGLSDRSPEMRRAVYDKARSALITQMRSLDPPLSEADITRERLALDEAIGRIEAGFEDGPASLDQDPPPVARLPAGPDLAPAPERVQEAEPPVPPEPAPRERPRVGTVAPGVARAGRGRNVVVAAALALVIGAIAVAAWLLRDPSPEPPRETAVVEAPRPAESEGKIVDRVAGERPPTAPPPPQPAAPAPAAPSAPPPRGGDVAIAQRAVLYEENPADVRTPKSTGGRSVWRLDAVNPGQGQALETAVRLIVEVPDASLTLNVTIQRNLDATLPASHTVDLQFATGPDASRSVRDVGAFALKNEESQPGAPLAGLPVPVTPNRFLIGLSNLPRDIERNTELLLRRNWIDLPIRFASGQRAVISFEKGVAGEQILAEAFRRWQP